MRHRRLPESFDANTIDAEDGQVGAFGNVLCHSLLLVTTKAKQIPFGNDKQE